ncbi:L-threonylcarbamoyladenylate synthase [Candidatus Uabimicrobium amorphum]|uniref:L-threonylcarbamoyladenylate synthase n=1 Tax=Uabimicrobium amorphum TaxID=2596890 RepID=A0A5S9F1J1_UABAM|nr:L-threonylcarbamoyladenylate synthase [Candidatus Uabimicrobium amorphum]BBM82626.1 threonylcarbamoyl-AMP synthase [Candidatus Uabimicrobium amorphum]
MDIIKLQDNYEEVVAKAVATLKAGNIVIYPTETCYGVGVDATNQQAVDKVLAYKSKRADKALSVAVPHREMAEEYVELNNTAINLYNLYLPGPITVISRGKNKVANHVQAANGTLGIRIPDYKLVRDIAQSFGKPITATSANASYKKTPYKIDDILQNTSQKQQSLIGLIIDAGQLPKRKPSIVTDTTVEDLKVLRRSNFDFKNFSQLTLSCEKDTENFAKEIFDKINEYVGKNLIVFLLQGDLGTGKTFFTRTLSKHLNVEGAVSSPTFILCREHKLPQSEGRLYHIDTYRMFDAKEMDDLRCEQMFNPPNIVVIEWADKVRTHIQPFFHDAIVVDMHLKHIEGEKRELLYAMRNF